MKIFSAIKSLFTVPLASKEGAQTQQVQQPIRDQLTIARTTSPALENTIASPPIASSLGSSQKEGTSFTTSKLITSIEDSDRRHLDTWRANSDIVLGLRFVATMQLRTPLRVLQRHGELHTNSSIAPPRIADEMWEGIWLPQTKGFVELGRPSDDFAESSMATEIGPIKGGIRPYLAFLCAVRTCVEAHDPIEVRVENLKAVLAGPDYTGFVRRHGGANAIIDRFFPPFLNTIPGLPATAITELRSKRLSTLSKLSAVSDETLLAIKGIGPAKLKTLRAYCNTFKDGMNEKRLDLVKR